MDIEKLDSLLKQIQVIDKNSFESVLHFFPNDITQNNCNCKFFLIKCEKAEIRENDFIEFILDRIVVYILKRKEYLLEGLSPQERASRIRQLVIRAKSKMITKNINTGEGGELILFLLLESYGIIQLLNKMNLKTSPNVAYHGLDAIHIEANDGIKLHYGESKMYGNFTQGVKEAAKTIKDFDLIKEKFELNLVSSYIDESKFGIVTDEIVDLISPYSKNKESLSKVNSIFIGFDWKLLSETEKWDKSDLTKFLIKNYEMMQNTLFSEIEETLRSIKFDNNRTFNFYILPFANVNEFRKNYLEALKE